MRAKWDKENGLSALTVFTNEGYFVTMGKAVPEHEMHNFEFTKDN